MSKFIIISNDPDIRVFVIPLVNSHCMGSFLNYLMMIITVLTNVVQWIPFGFFLNMLTVLKLEKKNIFKFVSKSLQLNLQYLISKCNLI